MASDSPIEILDQIDASMQRVLDLLQKTELNESAVNSYLSQVYALKNQMRISLAAVVYAASEKAKANG